MVCSTCRKIDFADYDLHNLIKSYRPDLQYNKNEIRKLATAFKNLVMTKVADTDSSNKGDHSIFKKC
jgi:hypothetical protein